MYLRLHSCLWLRTSAPIANLTPTTRMNTCSIGGFGSGLLPLTCYFFRDTHVEPSDFTTRPSLNPPLSFVGMFRVLE